MPNAPKSTIFNNADLLHEYFKLHRNSQMFCALRLLQLSDYTKAINSLCKHLAHELPNEDQLLYNTPIQDVSDEDSEEYYELKDSVYSTAQYLMIMQNGGRL